MIHGLKPYPAMKDSGVPWLGQVPEHWDVRRLKQLCRFAYGDSLPTDTRQDGSVAVFGSNGRVGAHASANTQAPCIVIGRKGSFGKVNFSYEPVFAIDTTFFVDQRFTQANLRWLSYLLGWLRLDEVSKDSAVPGLDREDAYQQIAVYPADTKEQAAIVRFLDHADRRIRRYIRAKQKLIKLLEEQKQAIIHRAVTRGPDPNVRLKPSGVEWLGDVPEHWEVKRLKALVTRVTSGSRGWSNFAADNGPLFIRIGNLTRGSIDLDLSDAVRLNLPSTVLGEAARTGLKPNDLLLSITAFIGSVAVVPRGFEEAYISQHVACCRPVTGVANARWLAYVLLSPVGQTHGQLCMYGGTKQGLSLDDVKNYLVLIPPRDEQDQLVESIEKDTQEVNSAIASTKREISLLREWRTRLIADVVTGKLDVRAAAANLPDEADEPEAPADSEALAEGDEDTADGDLDAAPEEAEA